MIFYCRYTCIGNWGNEFQCIFLKIGLRLRPRLTRVTISDTGHVSPIFFPFSQIEIDGRLPRTRPQRTQLPQTLRR